MKILGRARKSPRISENFKNVSNPFLRSLNDLGNIWKISEATQKCFQDVFNILEFSENLWKSLEVSENLRKTSETVQK